MTIGALEKIAARLQLSDIRCLEPVEEERVPQGLKLQFVLFPGFPFSGATSPGQLELIFEEE